MKRKRIVIIGVLIILVVGSLYFLKEKNIINNSIKEDENVLEIEDYSVDLEDKNDYYLLTIQTNIMTSPFKFKYDNNKFVLDTSNKIFDNAMIKDDVENNLKEIQITLESNEVYKFYFVKKTDAKLVLEKTLFIDCLE